MRKRLAVLLPAAALLAGCSAAGDVETLLRAPQLSGESAALQKALNSYLGGSATLKYPASGDFLSPFAFGDWDGDGTYELQTFYIVSESAASKARLRALENALKESEAAQRNADKISSFVREGFEQQ